MKRKWKSAEEKKRYEQLTREWNEIKDKHAKFSTTKQKIIKADYATSSTLHRVPANRSTHSHIPSIADTSGIGCKKESIMYTGDKMKGLSIVHKSCIQPIFSDQEAKEHASMRR